MIEPVGPDPYQRPQGEPPYDPEQPFRGQPPYPADPRYAADPGYQDPRYEDPRYHDPRYHDPRYRDPRYPAEPQYPGDSGYPADPRYPGDSGYPADPRYPGDSGYAADPRYAGDGYPADPRYPAQPSYHPEPGYRAAGPSDHGHDPDAGGALPIGPRHGSGSAGPLRARRSSSRRPSGRGPEPVSAGRAAIGAVVEVVVVLAMALVLSLLIKTFLVQAFFIPSASMETTLLIGDRVLVSKLTPGPFALHHGDIVVFKDPGGWLPATQEPEDGPVKKALRESLTFVGLLPQDSGEHLIKRVIGLPGDTVQCCDAKGRVSVNGVAIDETPYLYAGDEPSLRQFSITVPAGKLWVQGDHRTVSDDSRAHQDLAGGFVPIDDVVGKAFVIVWPFNRAGGLGVPDRVFANVPEREST